MIVDIINSIAGAGFIVGTSLATAVYYMIRYCRTNEYLMIGRATPFFFTVFVYMYIIFLDINNQDLMAVRAMTRINVVLYALSFGLTAYTAERVRRNE